MSEKRRKAPKIGRFTKLLLANFLQNLVYSELYVIYTGERQERPSEISLSKEFFGGKACAIDITVKMIYDGTVSEETGKAILSINMSFLLRFVMSK